MSEKVDQHHQSEAKTVVDMLFNADVFKEGITRDSMNALEDYLALVFQGHTRTAQLSADFTHKWKDTLKGGDE